MSDPDVVVSDGSLAALGREPLLDGDPILLGSATLCHRSVAAGASQATRKKR